MAIELDPQETKDALASLQHYFREELEMELSEMRARFLLEYILKEIGPLAYNRGVKDAEDFLRGKLEDLSATCFEHGLSYWATKSKK